MKVVSRRRYVSFVNIIPNDQTGLYALNGKMQLGGSKFPGKCGVRVDGFYGHFSDEELRVQSKGILYEGNCKGFYPNFIPHFLENIDIMSRNDGSRVLFPVFHNPH